MTSPPLLIPNSAQAIFPSGKRLAKMLALVSVVWLVFTAIGALTSLNDDLRAGFQPDYIEIFKEWSRSTTALTVLGSLLYLSFLKWPKILKDAYHVAMGYGILLLFLLPLQLLFVVKNFIEDASQTITIEAIQTQILVIDRYSCLLRFSTVTAVYFAVAIIRFWQMSQARDKAWAEERTSLLALKLELEEQRLLALRAQLEPHFVFNALNAISALVLSDNKPNALNGINGLSDLLRYALTASEQNWVTFEQELRFIDDYLALQKLRYGDRMRVYIEGVNDIIKDADCPPLLLQPLIENALRHDLDCHQDSSDIHVRFSADETHLTIRVSNPLHHDVSPNPGAGLGLRNIQARIDLAYRGNADLQTSVDNDCFVVALHLPLYKDE